MIDVRPVVACDSRVVPLLERVLHFRFDERQRARLRRARAWLALDEAGDPIGAATVEQEDEGWHLWLLGVLPDQRSRGAGRGLVERVEHEARDAGQSWVRVKTYREHDRMAQLLRHRGWTFHRAELGRRHDRVAEHWRLPLRVRPLRAVLVGANRSGRGGELAQAIERSGGLVELAGVCDTSPEVRRSFSPLPGGADLAELLDRIGEVHAVLLALPHHAYRAVRSVCLERGLAVFHEKPLEVELAQMIELQQRLTERPCPLVVGVQRRSHPSYVYLRSRLERSAPRTLLVRMKLGRQDSSQGFRRSWSEAGGGALVDIGYHAVDLVHYLLDGPLHVASCTLRAGGRPARAGELESSAVLAGRCGPTWVRIEVDRAGSREETVEARVDQGNLRATRDAVTLDGQGIYSCEGMWEAALQGRLVELVLACQAPRRPPDLWDHLAALQVIEQAYTQSAVHGLGRVR